MNDDSSRAHRGLPRAEAPRVLSDQDFCPLVNQLGADVDFLERQAFEGHSSAARLYVMGVRALVEASVHGIKSYVLASARRPVGPEEVRFVTGRRYTLGEAGQLEQGDIRSDKMLEIRFAFALFAQWLYRMEWEPNYDGEGWEAVALMFRVHDRLHRPGGVADIEVTPVELREVRRASEWFVRNVNLMLLESIRKMCADLNQPLDPSWYEWERRLLADVHED